MPVITMTLIVADMVKRVVWVMPRDSLRLQAEKAFTDPGWCAALGYVLIATICSSVEAGRGRT